jgi:hypothetical protein
VVNFVLEQFGQIAGGFHHALRAMLVGVTNVDFDMAADADHEVGDRETIVPQLHRFAAGAGYRRIDERERFADVEKDQAAADADLRGGYPSAEAVLQAEIVERHGQIAD